MIENKDIIEAFSNTKAFDVLKFDENEKAIMPKDNNRILIRIVSKTIYFEVSLGRVIDAKSLYLGDFSKDELKKLADSFFIKKNVYSYGSKNDFFYLMSIKNYYKFNKLYEYKTSAEYQVSANFKKTDYFYQDVNFSSYMKDCFRYFSTVNYKNHKVFVLHCQFKTYLYDYDVTQNKKLVSYLINTKYGEIGHHEVEKIIEKENFYDISTLSNTEDSLIQAMEKYFKIKNNIEILKELNSIKKNLENLIVKINNNI